MSTPDSNQEKDHALDWIRELRQRPEGEWLRFGDDAMTKARKVGATRGAVAEAADLPL